jgi:hypothetical protein
VDVRRALVADAHSSLGMLARRSCTHAQGCRPMTLAILTVSTLTILACMRWAARRL